MSNAPSIVYHYCSLDSFFAIINHSTIRLSNIAKSNDREEVRHCFDIFEKTLRDSCLEFSKYYGCRKFFDNIDYNDLVSRAVTNDSLIYYVSCFSAESDLLSQWRGYADDGRGVAIGFYSKAFVSAKDFKNIKYNKVIYDASAIKNDLHDYIIRKLKDAYNRYTPISPYIDAINDIISGMIYNAIFYKNPAFIEESEWRLVIYPFGNIRNLLIKNKSSDLSSNQLFYDRMYELIEYKSVYNDLACSNLQFRCANGRIISYIDVSFEKNKNSTIAEIILGPKSNIDDRDLRLFLMSNGYDLSKIVIKRSTATYR